MVKKQHVKSNSEENISEISLTHCLCFMWLLIKRREWKFHLNLFDSIILHQSSLIFIEIIDFCIFNHKVLDNE